MSLDEAQFARVMSGEIDGYAIEKRYLTRSGTTIPVELFVKCVRRADGSPDYFVAMVQDISERKRAELEKAELQVQLLQAQKLEAVGQLAGGVAHVFNNLLQVIEGYTEFAQQDLPRNHTVQEALGKIAGAASRAATLVDQLLAFSRRQVMRPESLDLNEVISVLSEAIGRIAGDSIAVQVHSAAPLNRIIADRSMIEQTILNLCVNAREAMSDSGVLTIKTGEKTLDEEFCDASHWAVPGEYVSVEISDTGCGMSAELLDHIFEPFFTTKDKSGGGGLGLATAYGMVRQYAGLIHAESTLAKGSTFTCYFPVSPSRTALADRPQHPYQPSGAEVILLAEDDEAVRMLTERILRNAGYQVITAADGREAVEMVAQSGVRIDMLLFDVVMPNMGGREASDAIHKTHPEIPVLYYSGYSENAIHANFVLNEETRLLEKPFKPKELLERVRETLESARR
ncbi:MAG: response regulator [Candidatus Hydrogenedens sp.]|nr:response regulator [Candidatus Hydrogenedens sp.]